MLASTLLFLLPTLLSCFAAVPSAANHTHPERQILPEDLAMVRIATEMMTFNPALPYVELKVDGLKHSSTFLHFKAERVEGQIKFRLVPDRMVNTSLDPMGRPTNPFALGRGDFQAVVGRDTVRCYLEAKADANLAQAPAQLFRFQNAADHGSYLYPCNYKDRNWAQVVCGGPVGGRQATCDESKWILS